MDKHASASKSSQLNQFVSFSSFYSSKQQQKTKIANFSSITPGEILECPEKLISGNVWLSQKCEISINAFYWAKAISLQATLFIFVRSMWEANFEMFVSLLKAIVTLMFALDDVHYEDGSLFIFGIS